MSLLRTFAPWGLVVLLGYQVCASSGERRGADLSGRAARGNARGGAGKSSATGRGKFLIDEEQDKQMQCTWVAQDVADAVRLSVKCEDARARIRGGVTELQCQYHAKPQLCPGYQSNPKGFWKQVSRAFKRLQSNVCNDVRVLVRTGMCKGAPRAAHFKLAVGSSVASARSGGEDSPSSTPEPAACAAQSRRKAEEHCNSSWASLCAFFFSMVENDC